MADFIFIRRSRNALSSFLHVLLNILLAIGSIFITVVSGSWFIGVVLVLVSKWRTFAVRPRFWPTNIRASLVDLIVGFSFIFLAYHAGTTFSVFHLILAILYVIWLLVVKTLTTSVGVVIQALCAVFIGSTAAAILAARYDSIVLVFLESIISYGASRHVLIQSDDHDISLITATCGLLGAEIAWLCHSWLIVYTYDAAGIVVPQLAIIMTALAFLFYQLYLSLTKHDGHLKFSEIIAPTVFTILIVAVVVLGFSQPIFNI